MSEFKKRFQRWMNGEKVYEAGKILPEVIVTADDPIKKLVEDVNARSNADFVNRAKDPNRTWIQDWENKNKIATHKLSWAEDNGKVIVFPEVQNINGKLHDFTNPKYNHGKWDALDSAIERGDTLLMTPELAKMYTENYKKYYPKGKTFDCGKPLPKYDGGTDNKTYLPEYEYEATVTPQGTSLEKHKRITNEEDWLKYWGNVGAGYVNLALEAAAPVVLNGMSMLMGNPVGALAGILGSEVGSELGAKISPLVSTIGGLVGGIALDPTNIKSAVKYTQKAVPRVMALSARKASALAYLFFPNKTSKFYDRLLNNVNIGNEIKPLYTDIDVTDSRYIGKGQMHVVVQNPDDINSVLKFGTDPMSKRLLQRRILSLNRTNGFEYLEPELYLGYMLDPTNSESFYEVLKLDKVIPKDKTEIFNPDTKKMKSLKELFSADKEQYKILERIKEIAKRSGADKSAFDGNYIIHNGSVIQDFGHRHNIGYNLKGSPIIFDPAISTPKHVELVDMVFPWLIRHDSGKSIHINPANKGKFNATKKRTGKTTEQLAHSKNPLTRKRAIFALNARKWKH